MVWMAAYLTNVGLYGVDGCIPYKCRAVWRGWLHTLQKCRAVWRGWLHTLQM